MKKFKLILILISTAVLAIVTTSATYACPPKVIKAVPDNGERNVEPSLKQVRIEFDQDMNTTGYSICGGGPDNPKATGRPRWVDKRTLVMPVKLEPNHDYEMSVNCPSYQACRNTQGEPAVIYPIKFRTGSAQSGADEKSKCTVILLQEGLHAEETEGNLDKAMEIYQRVIDESAGNQSVAASATYQLGMCHLKKGNSKEAEEYFQQVVTSYSNEKSVAAKASKRLEELGIRNETPANLFDILGPEVCSHIRSIYKEICVEAGAKKVYSNGPMYLVDDNFVLHRGGMGYITNCTGAPINKRHRICGTSYPFQKLYDVQGNPLDVEIVEDEQRNGFYDIYWNPKEPLKAGDFFRYRWAMDKTTRLSPSAGGENSSVVMQNMLGRGGFETFFLVVPEGTIIVNQSDKYTTMDNFEGWDIYWWKKEVEENENHTVAVTLKGTAELAQEQKGKIRPGIKKSVFAQIDAQVIRFISEQYGKTAAEAGAKHLYANSHIYYVDPNFVLYNGGMNFYYNYTGRTIGVGENVGLSGTSYANQTLYDAAGKKLNTEIVADEDRPNFYHIYWIPDKPLAPGESLYYGWSMDKTHKLRAAQSGGYSLEMQNRFGSPVIETFFLVLPKDLKISQSVAPTGSEKLLNFDIYWWTKEVQNGENHAESLQLVKAEEVSSAEDKTKSVQSAVSTKPLKLEASPWVDGEVMEVRLKHPAGKEYGTIIYSAQSGENKWQIISHMYVSEGSVSQYTFVEAEVNNFAPVYGQTTNWMGNFVAKYSNGNVKLTVSADGKESTRDVPISGVAYDNEEALYLIRRMPLAENYEGSFPIFSVQGGDTVECRIKVLGVEEVAVEAGTFKCYKTDLTVYSENVKTLQHTLWFSADAHKYLVKYDVGGSATMELAKVWQKSRGEALTFKNSKPAFTVTVPADWRFYKYSSGVQSSLQLIPPGVKAWAILVWQKRRTDPDFASAKTVAKADCEKLKNFFENYTVDESSWKELKISSLEAAQYIANYQESGNALQKYSKPKDMVEYRTYIVDEANIYWFVFRIEKDKFEENKAELDSIVNSFNIYAK